MSKASQSICIKAKNPVVMVAWLGGKALPEALTKRWQVCAMGTEEAAPHSMWAA